MAVLVVVVLAVLVVAFVCLFSFLACTPRPTLVLDTETHERATKKV